MQLRINLALTNYRQVDITVCDTITPSDLLRVVTEVAHGSHGSHDHVAIQSVEELPDPEGVPHAPAA
jgi:hypothetical protein